MKRGRKASDVFREAAGSPNSRGPVGGSHYTRCISAPSIVDRRSNEALAVDVFCRYRERKEK